MKRENLVSLWKVTVNNWMWNHTKTYYAVSREACEKLASRFPAADDVEYAGRFNKLNADELIEASILDQDEEVCF